MTFNTNNRNNKVAGEVDRHYRQKRKKLQDSRRCFSNFDQTQLLLTIDMQSPESIQLTPQNNKF
jgi:hypothetical protein